MSVDIYSDEVAAAASQFGEKPKLLREDKSNKPDFTYVGEMYGAWARIMQRYQLGAAKYARLNWRNCEDPQTYRESAQRHFQQYLDGQTDEDHLAAAGANIGILLDLEEKEK